MAYKWRAPQSPNHYLFTVAMSTLTKRNLIADITNKLSHLELTQKLVTEIVDQFIDSVTEQLCLGEKVIIRNFGVFQVSEIKPKVGRNPRNPSKAIHIPACAVVKFKPGKEFKDKVSQTLPIIREKKA
jgi:nucleoid DNA-binding protein